MELQSRKREILRAVVRHYVETAEPVGSEWLAETHDFGVRSATIRNEMAEMAELGYLQQPHTSAGRIPSDKGYRFYVDWLITPRALTTVQRQHLRERLEKSRAEVERVLQQTCQMLSALTHYVSMATAPEIEQDAVRQIHLSVLDRRRLLVVVALASGRVEHAIMPAHTDLMSVELERIEQLVNGAVRGRTIPQAILEAGPEPAEPLSADGDSILQAVTAAVREALARIHSEEPGEVVVEGTIAVLRQPEFQSGDSVRGLVELLEERRQLFSILRDVYTREAQVIIGSESPDRRMQSCSLVAARYRVMGRYVGTIGVLGPTRMDYDRTVPAVRYMARSVGEILTRLSL